MTILSRAASTLLAATLFVPALATSAGAQRLRSTPLASADSLLLAARADVVRLALPAAPVPAERRASGGTGRTLLGTVGGAVVGAFIGYFVSQVVRSDWEEEAGTGDENRRAFAISGAALGAVAGFALTRRDPASVNDRLPRLQAPPAEGTNLDLLDRSEIVSSGATNAFEVIQSRRPRWLSTRGTNTFREEGRILGYDDRRVVLEKGRDQTIIVYLNQARIGGVEALREISAATILAIHHLDARAATYRFGIGHDHGAIVVLTQ